MCISGGKDSMLLAKLLQGLHQKHRPCLAFVTHNRLAAFGRLHQKILQNIKNGLAIMLNRFSIQLSFKLCYL